MKPSVSIGIDARMWSHPGIGRYIRELSRQLLSRSSHRFIFLGDPRIAGDLPPERKDRWEVRSARSRVYGLSEQFEIPRRSAGAALLHVPHFNIPVFFKGPLVVTVHDLIYLQEPRGRSSSLFGKAYVAWLFKTIQKKADFILTVSENTKKELLERFPKLRPDRVAVTHEAASPFFRKIEDAAAFSAVKKRRGLEKPFVLFVGTLKPHKNLSTLIRAFGNLKKKEDFPHELVLVGRKDPRNQSDLELIAENSFVHYLGELPDDELMLLYNAADLFVLPSLREGFGLPVLEAMACGVPVIASDRSSLPEVVGEAGLLFDPLRIDALEELLYNVLRDAELRKRMSKMSLERAGRFSWQETAGRTLEVYERVLQRSGS